MSLNIETDIESLLDQFIDFEMNNHLFEIRVKGENFWDFIRYEVLYRIVFQKTNFSFPKKQSRLQTVLRVIRKTIPLCVLLMKRRRYDTMLFLYERTNLIDGKKVNIHIYPLVKLLHKKHKLLVIDLFNTIHQESDYPCDVLMAEPVYIWSRAASLFASFSPEEKEIFGDIRSKLLEAFDIEIDIEQTARKIFFPQLANKICWRGIFSLLKPKSIMFCDDGSMKGIISAAKSLGIKTIDYQHSLISSLNVLYRYAPSKDIQCLTVPDYIFMFGEFWREEYKLPSRMVSVGFPYIESALQQMKVTSDSLREKNIIILSDGICKQQYIQIAMSLADMLPDFKIYFKLRPDEYAGWRTGYPEAMGDKKNLIMIDNNKISLYEYFSTCRYQIGTNSTALYEGIYFGLVTYVLKVGWCQEMNRLIRMNAAFLVDDPAQIAAMIKSGQRPSSELARDLIFKNDSSSSLLQSYNMVLSS